jgi:hypothetical protein
MPPFFLSTACLESIQEKEEEKKDDLSGRYKANNVKFNAVLPKEKGRMHEAIEKSDACTWRQIDTYL